MRGILNLFNYLCSKKFTALVILGLFFNNFSFSQTPLFSDIPVSDNGTENNLGSANTSRNIGVNSNGDIFIVYANQTEIRISRSIDGGQTFLPSILVNTTSVAVEPEIAINDADIIFIAWIENETINFTRSTDEGNTFSTIETFGTITPSPNPDPDVHMSTFGSNVYLIDQDGKDLYYNNNNGLGGFTINNTGLDMVYADVLTSQNGTLFIPLDNPRLILRQSTDQGNTLTDIPLNPSGQVYFSSYALSDGPCGTFIFVGGGGSAAQSETLGYKINALTGETSEITLGPNSTSFEGRTLFADNEGTFIDGYRDASNNLIINVSSDQGNSFSTPIVVANGASHNIAKSAITNNILVTYSRNGQIFLTVYDNIVKSVSIPDPTPPLVFCSNETFDLNFTLTGIFSSGSIFSVSLSDENGSFTNATEIGTITTDTSGVISCTIPNGLMPSNNYALQIESVANCIQSNIIPVSIGVGSVSGDSEACEGDTIQLTNTGTPNATNPWTSSNTNVATINNNGLVTTINNGNTDITFTTDNGCSIVFPIEVFEVPTFNQNITLNACDENATGFADFNTSAIESTILNGQTGMVITYFDSNGTQLSSPLPNPINSANQTLTARIENATNSSCFSEIEIELILDTTPIANQIPPQEMCEDIFIGVAAFDTSTIENSILNGQTGITVSYIDSSGMQLPSPLPNPFNSETQTITVNLETAGNCSTQTTIDFIVREKPRIDLDREVTFCRNNSNSLTIPINNPNTNYTYTWTDENGTQVGQGESLNVTSGGIYNVTASTQFMCTSNLAQINVIESFPPEISENDITISTDGVNSISIDNSQIPSDLFEYSLLNSNGDIVFNYQDSPLFYDVELGLYTVLVRSKNNCGEDSVEVSIINFPAFFTPNGDNINENWVIEGFNSSFYPTTSIYIFNRYGKVMAKLPAENPSWNGTYNGANVPSSDYWYRVKLIDIYGRMREEKGHFSLLRK